MPTGVVWPDAQRAQAVREPVGPRVQLARRSARSPSHTTATASGVRCGLRLERARGCSARRGYVARGAVPRRPAAGAARPPPAAASARRGCPGRATIAASRTLQWPSMRSIVARVEQVGAVLERAARPPSASRQRRASGRTSRVARAASERLARAGPAAPAPPSGVFCSANIDLEQRRVAQVALRAAAPRPASRTAGPGARTRPAPSRAPAPAARGSVGSPDRSRAQHQRVDEEADQPLELAARCGPAIGVPTTMSSCPL